MKKFYKGLSPFNFIMLTVAGIINALAITLFLAPLNLLDSGISGTSMLVSEFTPEFFNLSVLLLIFNLPFFIIGIKKQGFVFTVYSIYVITIYAVVSFLINNVFTIDFSNGSPIVGQDILLCAFFGGLLSGVGSGFAIRFGGAMDGVEVMSVIFAKRIGISVGSFIMIYNAILYITAGAIWQSWIIPLYSILTYIVGLKAIDFTVEGFDKAKAAVVITNKRDEVARELSENLGRGVTILDAVGYYSNESKAYIYCVVNRFQISKLKTVVKDIDENAFIAITEITDTFDGKVKLKKYN